MLGIDIVDIKDPSFQERNERSFSLIQNEKDVRIDHEFIFWLFWSAKEAVFKYKREPQNFAPTKIPISIIDNGSDIAFISGNIHGKFIISNECIIALCGDLDNIDFQLFKKSDDSWSEGIRFMIIDFFRAKGHDYHIGSDDLNLPTIEPDGLEISISHHGRFGAVAFPKSLLQA